MPKSGWNLPETASIGPIPGQLWHVYRDFRNCLSIWNTYAAGLSAYCHLIINPIPFGIRGLFLSGVPDFFDRNKILSGGDLSHYQVPHCIRVFFIPPPNEVGGGVYWIHLVRPSVRLSVCPSVCRRHGFRSISQVCFGISISNFICMLMVAIGRSLLIFSDVTFKMTAWRPYWIFWFPDSNFTSALNINFKLQRHNTYVYG